MSAKLGEAIDWSGWRGPQRCEPRQGTHVTISRVRDGVKRQRRGRYDGPTLGDGGFPRGPMPDFPMEGDEYECNWCGQRMVVGKSGKMEDA